jgi:D-glycero-alpha-D-manno-heptose-7-phosphate kinase
MRISFAGGGTDVPGYYERHGGMVVSAAIDKYVYVFVSPNHRASLQISSSDYSTFIQHEGGEVEESGRLRYARAFMREFGISSGLSVFIASEMPPGTGLGSSSSLAVALTKALSVLRHEIPAKPTVAESAARTELGRLGMPIGKQDHYASAFGGINVIRFSAGGVDVEPLPVSDQTRRWLVDSLLLFFTDQSHSSQEILAEQTRRSRDDPATVRALHAIKGHAEEVRRALLDEDVESLGDILHRTWTEKKQLAGGISNDRIDTAYEEALAAGATGGKIAGAGGGGFLLLVCPPEHRAAVTATLARRGMVRSDFQFDDVGARVLVNNAAA